jgi:GNAT superfamily N-acetyltransferase
VNGKEAFLRDLFVEPQYFREGIGRALFHAAADYARQRGSTNLLLEGDPNAREFYERLGMVLVGEQPSIAGGGRMLPVMRLSLDK